MTVIDTPGFAEEDFEEEDRLMYDIIDELKNTIKNVNVFIIILNGEQTSMDGKFESMIGLFGKIFGNQFWNNVLLQTDWTFDDRAISTRGENNETKWESDWNDKLRNMFTDIPVSKIFWYHGLRTHNEASFHRNHKLLGLRRLSMFFINHYFYKN